MPNIDVNGQIIDYPDTGDPNWGDNATNFAIQTSSALGKLGLDTGTSVDIPQTLDVTGNTTLDANLSVAGTTSLTGNVTLTNNLTVNGNTSLGNANTDSIVVTGIVNIDSGVLYVDPVNNRVGINDTTPSEALDVTGNALISGTLGVTGATSLSSTLAVTGDVSVNTNKFNVTASSGNTTIAGTLGISNGTASAPSLTPSGDTNTGLYSIGSDKIGFAANGVRQGEFGIGYGGFTGNIIQVVNSENDYTHTITNNANWNSDLLSAVGTTWEIAITPKYNNSKTIIKLSQNGLITNTTTNAFFGISIWRKIGAGAYSQIQIPQTDAGGSFEFGPSAGGATSVGIYFAFPKLYVDSPGSTSVITYKFSVRTYQASSFIANINATPNKGKSFCVLQEVQQ